MAGVEVGTAYVTVVPSAKGFVSRMQAEVGGSMTNLGTKAGDTAAKGFGARFKSGMKTAVVAGVAGLVAAGALGLSFAKGAVAEARESQKVGAVTAQVIKSTGGAAKVSAEQVGDLATAISNKTGIDDESIQSGANMLLTFKNIRNEAGKGNDIFNQTTGILTDMSAAMGTEPKQAAIQLGKALNDPVKGISALSRVGVTFTDQQKKTIKSLVDGGKTAEAQKIILNELKSEFGGTAEASATMGEKLSTSFGNFKEQIGTALLPIIDKVEAVLVTKVIPALSQFFTEMQNGTGKGGQFVGFVKDAAGVLGSLAGFVKRNSDVIVPLVAAVAVGVGVFKLVTTAVKIWTGAQIVLNAVMTANPIGAVIAIIAALVVGIIVAYKKSETFRNIVKGAFEAISAAARFMWNNVVAPVIRFLIGAFVSVTEFYAKLLRGLSKIPGFGWAKGAADALQNVADKAAGIKNNIHDIPSKKDVTVNFHVNGTGQVTLANGVKVDVGQFKARASGGPVRAGEPYVVGERRPELFVPETNGRIIPRVPGGGGDTYNVYTNDPLEAAHAVERRQNMRLRVPV